MARRRYELTDGEWSVVEPLLPNKPRGVPRVDDRRVLNGILVERFFNRIKHFRRIAPRHDKCPENDIAAVKLICTRIWCTA